MYFTATRRLQQRGSERIAESYGDELWRHIDHILHTVTSEVVAHADADTQQEMRGTYVS
jgi:hypothetical protein